MTNTITPSPILEVDWHHVESLSVVTPSSFFALSPAMQGKILVCLALF